MEISFNDMRQATHYIPGQQPIPEEGMGQDLGHPHNFLHTPLLSSGWRAGQYSLKRWISTPPMPSAAVPYCTELRLHQKDAKYQNSKYPNSL